MTTTTDDDLTIPDFLLVQNRHLLPAPKPLAAAKPLDTVPQDVVDAAREIYGGIGPKLTPDKWDDIREAARHKRERQRLALDRLRISKGLKPFYRGDTTS